MKTLAFAYKFISAVLAGLYNGFESDMFVAKNVNEFSGSE